MPHIERFSTGLSPSALSRLGSLSAILAAVILMASLLSFFVALPGLGLRNWLVVLFALNAGLGGLPADPLRVLNPLDFAVLVLVGVSFLGLRPALGTDKNSRIWSAIAAALPFAGMAILLATKLAGRSSVMGAGLVIAFLMFKGHAFKPLAPLGILANALLLGGDLATGWLLEEDNPIVAYIARVDLMGESETDREAKKAREAIMSRGIRRVRATRAIQRSRVNCLYEV